jgi:hypothetical protein
VNLLWQRLPRVAGTFDDFDHTQFCNTLSRVTRLNSASKPFVLSGVLTKYPRTFIEVL